MTERTGNGGNGPTARKAPNALAVLRLGSLLLPLLGGIIWGIWSYQDEMARGRDRAQENVALTRQFVHRLVQIQMTLHSAARQHALQLGADALGSAEFHQFLAGIEAPQDASHGIAVMTLDGRVIASSRSHPTEVQFGQRDYLDKIAAGQPVAIDRRILEPAGDDALIVGTRFDLPDFSGVIVSTVAVTAVREFLSGIASGPREAASLMTEDGIILLRHVPSVPMRVAPETLAMQARAVADSGFYRSVGLADGIERLYAFSKLDDLPLFANFGTPVRELRLSWLSRAAPIWGLLAVIAAFSFFLSGQVRRAVVARLAAEESHKRLEQAERLAAQRVQLLQELNHRVKNNLALVESMIGMQLRHRGQVDAVALRARVHAIAEVHDLLHKATDALHVDLGLLLRQICESAAVVPPERGIALDLRLERGIRLGADTAGPLALIATELVTNSVKHAFPDRPGGTIRVALTRDGPDHAVLEIADDGRGAIEEGNRSSGLKIVGALVSQIEGQLTTTPGLGTSGIGFRLVFPVREGALAQLQKDAQGITAQPAA